MQQQDNYDKKRKVFFIVVLLLFLPLIVAIIILLSRIGKIEVATKFAPFSSEVKLNGSRINNNGSNFVSPGTYDLEVSLSGFSTYTEKITVDSETKYIYGCLEPNSDEGLKLLENNRDCDSLEELQQKENIESNVAYSKKYPLLSSLPVKRPTFSIGYTYLETEETPTLTIDATSAYINSAIKALKDLGKDYTEYNVIITDFDNPFEKALGYDDSSSPSSTLSSYLKTVSGSTEILSSQQVDDYYLAKFIYKKKGSSSSVNYYVILKKEGDLWKVSSPAYPVLTVFNTPDIPKEIILRTNSL